jgi:4-amino-4-deoxy-L-arabinose transferase-like glycosyltransferase
MNLGAFKKLDFYLVVILLLTLWGFILRIYALGYQSLWNDEAELLNAASGILDHGLPILPSGHFYERAILNTNIIAFSFTLFGTNEFAARLPSVIFGTLTIPLVFLFAKRVGNEKIALIAATITAFSMLEIAWSRQARMYQELQFFYILSLYLFYRFIETKSKWGLALTVLSTICAILSHRLGFALILIFPLYAFLLNIRNIKGFLSREFLLQRKSLVFIIFILFLTAGLLVLGQTMFGVFSIVLNKAGNIHLHYCLWYVVSTLPLISIGAVAGAVICHKENRRASLFLILSIVVPSYFISFHLGGYGYRHLYFLLPIIFVLFSHAVIRLNDLIPRLVAKRILSLLFAVIILGLTLYSSSFVFAPQRVYYHFDPTIQMPDFKRAYAFVEENRSEDDILIDAWPVVGIIYSSKTPDYCLIPWYVETTEKGELRETFTGVPYIRNLGMLKAITEENEKGWLVLDTFAWNSLRHGIRDLIDQNLIRYEEGSSTGEQGDIMVYGWTRQEVPEK